MAVTRIAGGFACLEGRNWIINPSPRTLPAPSCIIAPRTGYGGLDYRGARSEAASREHRCLRCHRQRAAAWRPRRSARSTDPIGRTSIGHWRRPCDRELRLSTRGQCWNSEPPRTPPQWHNRLFDHPEEKLDALPMTYSRRATAESRWKRHRTCITGSSHTLAYRFVGVGSIATEAAQRLIGPASHPAVSEASLRR